MRIAEVAMGWGWYPIVHGDARFFVSGLQMDFANFQVLPRRMEQAN